MLPGLFSFLCVLLSKTFQFRLEILTLLEILLIAAVFRWTALDWDQYRHFHPDERYITWVATTIERPSNFATALIPDQSTFNPFYWPADVKSAGIVVPQDEPRSFAYGHLPLYLGVMATRLVEAVSPVLLSRLPQEWLFTSDILNGAEQAEYFHLTAVARALTGLFDLGTIVLVYILGRRLYGTAVGLLSAAFLTFNVMHIQLAHFFIVDPYLTFFVVAAIVCWVEAIVSRNQSVATNVPNRRATFWVGAGTVFLGFAVGSKFAAVLLFLPLLITVAVLWPESWRRLLIMSGFVALTAFFLTNPFALIDFSCELLSKPVQAGPISLPELNWRSCYLENIFKQSSMVRGAAKFPFTRQYSGTIPYLYYIEMQLKWGMGPLLGLVAFVGFGGGLWLCLCPGFYWLKRAWQRKAPDWIELRHFIRGNPSVLLLAWCVPFFMITGGFYVKFMRYLQPLVPFLMIFGAALLWGLKRPLRRNLAVGVTLVSTIIYAAAFLNMYRTPHPWLVGSTWIYVNAPANSLILSERWDDSLPTSLHLNGTYRRSSEYQNEELTWLSKTGARDNEAKLSQNIELLAKADYLTLTSNRIYGVVPRLPEQYPISHQYHAHLFSGALGYEPVFVFARSPNLWGWQLRPDTFGKPNLQPPALVAAFLASPGSISLGKADESFTVYDQPLTIIFENKAHLSQDEMLELFEIDE